MHLLNLLEAERPRERSVHRACQRAPRRAHRAHAPGAPPPATGAPRATRPRVC